MSDRFQQFNPNPDGIRVGDCTVRAICKATGKPWSEVYLGLCVHGFYLHDMPSANRVWGAYLKEQGFRRRPIDDDITVADFCRDHPEGTFLLCSDGITPREHSCSALTGISSALWMAVILIPGILGRRYPFTFGNEVKALDYQ